MSKNKLVAAVLVFLLAAPLHAAPAAAAGTLTGLVTTTAGMPLARINLEIVNLETGRVTAAQTDVTGAFAVRLDPGQYTVNPSQKGYSLARGPRVVKLASGSVASAELALASLAAQDPNATTLDNGGLTATQKTLLVLGGIGLATAIIIVATDDDDPNLSPSR